VPCHGGVCTLNHKASAERLPEGAAKPVEHPFHDPAIRRIVD
jgi:hypothetical protein